MDIFSTQQDRADIMVDVDIASRTARSHALMPNGTKT